MFMTNSLQELGNGFLRSRVVSACKGVERLDLWWEATDKGPPGTN